MGKKSQVAIYIIIGLVLVILVALLIFIFMRQSNSVGKEQIPEQIRISPATGFIEACFRTTAIKGLEILGSQGGFINPEDPTIIGRPLRFNQNKPTEGDGITLTQGGKKVPYWAYLSSENDCTDCVYSQNAPSLNLIKQQLDDYIEDNVRNCLGTFEGLKSQGIIVTEKSNLKVDTLIADNDLRINVDYPVEIEIEETKTEVKNHYIEIDLNLGKIYKLALEIANQELNQSFLEYNIMSLISYNSGTDSEMLPPISGTTSSRSPIVWSKFKTELDIKNELNTYTPLLTIPGTRNFRPISLSQNPNSNQNSQPSIENGIFYNFVVDILNENDAITYDDLEASFIYLNWPIYFDITPRQGDLIRPEEMSSSFANLMPFVSQNYRFFYDVSQPVIVEIKDPDAFNGEGYSFLVALEANIRNNDPLQPGTFIPITGITADSLSSSFSDPQQFISGIVTVDSKDDSNVHLSNVDIEYHCLTLSAYMGKTNNEGIFSSRFPICFNGVLRGTKPNYHSASVELNNQVGISSNINIKLPKLKQLNAELRVIDDDFFEQFQGVTNPSQLAQGLNPQSIPQPIYNEGDAIFISLDKIPETDFEEPFSTFLFFDKDNPASEIDLIPGRYTVYGQLIDGNGFLIPAKTVEVAGQEIEYPEIEIRPAPMGGVLIGEENPFVANREELNNANKIIFVVFKNDPPEDFEDLSSLGNLESISANYTTILMPRLVS